MDKTVEPKLRLSYENNVQTRREPKLRTRETYSNFNFTFRDDDDGQDEPINAVVAAALWNRVASKSIAPKRHLGYGGFTPIDQQFCINNVSGVAEQLSPPLAQIQVDGKVWKSTIDSFVQHLRSKIVPKPVGSTIGCLGNDSSFGSQQGKVDSVDDCFLLCRFVRLPYAMIRDSFCFCGREFVRSHDGSFGCEVSIYHVEGY